MFSTIKGLQSLFVFQTLEFYFVSSIFSEVSFSPIALGPGGIVTQEGM
jgi:hypothetical protein